MMTCMILDSFSFDNNNPGSQAVAGDSGTVSLRKLQLSIEGRLL